jgi:hypothetical protein
MPDVRILHFFDNVLKHNALTQQGIEDEMNRD